MVKYNLKNVTDILFFIFMSPFTRLPRGVINGGAFAKSKDGAKSRRLHDLFVFDSYDDLFAVKVNDLFELHTGFGKAAFSCFGRADVDSVACDMTVVSAFRG